MAFLLGLLATGLGLVQFRVQGLDFMSGDLREVAILAAALHLSRGWLVLVTAAVGSLGVADASMLPATLAIHALLGPAAWLMARYLKRCALTPGRAGLGWAGFVVFGYYLALGLPLLVVVNALLGRTPWGQFVPTLAKLVPGVLVEMATTTLVTSIHVVNLAELSLRRKAEARLAGILASSPVGLAVVRQGRISWVNDRLAEMAGEQPAALEGRPWAELAGPHIGHVQALAANPEDLDGEHSLVSADGQSTIVLCQSARHAGEEGATFTVSVQDITERIRMEQQLRQAQKMEILGQFTGAIAHDFGNLLQAVALTSQDLREGVQAGEPLGPGLDRLDLAINQARKLVGQLLGFSRRGEDAFGPVDLGALVTRMAPLLRTLLGRRISLELRVPPEPAVIHAAAGQVEQVLTNLVVNGRDAIQGREGGPCSLTISVARDGGRVLLTVADTGTGMDEATRQRIFEPFFTTKAPGKGTGLGLATVMGIVRRHDADLEVASRLGEGSSFQIAWRVLPKAA